MNSSPRILVVAPDAELRRSIDFALEAEGLHVILRAHLPPPALLEGVYDCAVVDESVVLSASDGWARLAAIPCATVLLVDRIGSAPRGHFTGSIIRKPLLGRSLVDRVLAALHARDREPTA